jgi:hypothetical protein
MKSIRDLLARSVSRKPSSFGLEAPMYNNKALDPPFPLLVQASGLESLGSWNFA